MHLRRAVPLLAVAAAALTAAALGPAPSSDAKVPLQHLQKGTFTSLDGTGRAAKGPRLRVDVRHGKHRISPDIYGVNFADASSARALGTTVDRWGGNTTETYNWQIRGANHGQDYYFENFADCWDDDHHYCQTGHDYSAADAQIEQDRATHTTTLLNLPAMGWVAKAVDYDGTHVCSYPSSAFDPQDDHDPYNAACGNGVRSGHGLDADPNRAGLQVGPSFSVAWIQSLVSRYGDAAHGGVGIYELGNEPALWDETHRDLHPSATTYDELWQKSRDLAAAVKGTDPTAATLGPAEWGWPNYFCSAADHVDQGCFASSPDRAAHGGTELSAWYLQQFAHYEQQTGLRLLDYFDLHYYPQGTYSPATDVTRSLDDPSYTDPSWINAKIDLLPRMRAWVKDNYPGTKTSISEYNFGLDVTDDARMQNVIEADALGLFGRNRLDLATFWPEDRSPVPAAAFRIFRNYDGRGHGFGDRGVAATSSDQGRVAIYAARVGKHGPLTLVVVNKSDTTLRSRVALRHARAGRAKAWQYAGGPIARVRGVHANRRGLAMSFPAESVTLISCRIRR